MGFYNGLGLVEEAADAVAHALLPAARFSSAANNIAWRQQDAQTLLGNAIRGDITLQSGLARLVALASPQSATNGVAYNNNPKYQDIYKAALRDYYTRTAKIPSPAIAALIGYVPPVVVPGAVTGAGLPIAPGYGVIPGATPYNPMGVATPSTATMAAPVSPYLLLGGAVLLALAMRNR